MLLNVTSVLMSDGQTLVESQLKEGVVVGLTQVVKCKQEEWRREEAMSVTTTVRRGTPL